MNLDIRELKVENREVQQDVRELKAENKELKQQNLLQEQTIKELKANFMAFKQRLDPLEEESKVIKKRGQDTFQKQQMKAPLLQLSDTHIIEKNPEEPSRVSARSNHDQTLKSLQLTIENQEPSIKTRDAQI